MTEQGIGARALRKEDQRFLRGKGRYTDDIALAGQAHAAFVRSPHAHARIERVETVKFVRSIFLVNERPAEGLLGRCAKSCARRLWRAAQ